MDVGWNRDLAQLSPAAVNGLLNEGLFAFIRRFCMQIIYAKAIQQPSPGHVDFDICISEDEDFSSDKLRAHLKRFCVTIKA